MPDGEGPGGHPGAETGGKGALEELAGQQRAAENGPGVGRPAMSH